MERQFNVRWATSPYVHGKHDGYRVRIDVEACGMSPNVFAYLMQPVDPQTGTKAGVFDHVCSPVDLEEYPENEPIPGSAPEWYRLSYVDVLLRSTQEVDNFLNQVLRDLKSLKTALDRLDNISPSGDLQIGSGCPSEPDEGEEPEPPPEEPPIQWSSVHTMTESATSELSRGDGAEWVAIGDGAGSEWNDTDHYSRVTLVGSQISKTLILHGYDFRSLPNNSRIEGISVRIRYRSSGPCPRLTMLYWTTDAHHSENRASGQCLDQGDWSVLEWGNSTDLWGIAELPPTELQHGGFDVTVLVTGDPENVSNTVDIAGAEVTVHYRVPE